MGDQDWETVTLKKTGGASKPKLATNQSVSLAKALGVVTTEKRFGAGGNSSVNSANLKKIEDDQDTFGGPKTVSASLSRAIIDARCAKKWSQQQLASEISERVQVIQTYENGTAVPSPQILNKLDRALGIHLPRANKKK